MKKPGIARIAPQGELVMPKKYGRTERVVSCLTEGLIAKGHEVTLCAPGDSITSATHERKYRDNQFRLDRQRFVGPGRNDSGQGPNGPSSPLSHAGPSGQPPLQIYEDPGPNTSTLRLLRRAGMAHPRRREEKGMAGTSRTPPAHESRNDDNHPGNGRR